MHITAEHTSGSLRPEDPSSDAARKAHRDRTPRQLANYLGADTRGRTRPADEDVDEAVQYEHREV